MNIFKILKLIIIIKRVLLFTCQIFYHLKRTILQISIHHDYRIALM